MLADECNFAKQTNLITVEINSELSAEAIEKQRLQAPILFAIF